MHLPASQTPEYYTKQKALFVSTMMSDCRSEAGGTGGSAGSNQFKSQSMFNPLPPALFNVLPILFYSQCSMFCPSCRSLVACQCSEYHPAMLDVMTESRKLVRLAQLASSQPASQAGKSEKVAGVPPRSSCSVTPLAPIYHQYYKPPPCARGVCVM